MNMIVAYFKNGKNSHFIVGQGSNTESFNSDLRENIEAFWSDPLGIEKIRNELEVVTIKLGVNANGALKIVSQQKLNVFIAGEVRLMLDGKDVTCVRFDMQEGG